MNPYRRLKHRLNTPYTVTVEPTTRCNSLCTYCARPKMVESGELEVGDMHISTFNQILKELENLENFSKLVFAGWGEPTLHSDLIDMLDLARSRYPHIRLCMLTNGITLTESLGKRLIDVGLDQLLISLNSFNPVKYESLNRVDAFDKVVSNINAFLVIKGAHNPRTIIQLLDIDMHQEDYDKFTEYWTPRLNGNDYLKFQAFESAGGRVEVSKYDSSPHTTPQYPCFHLWRDLTITRLGDVYPCWLGQAGGDSLKLGNLMEMGIADMMRGERLAKLRRLHKRSRYNAVQACIGCDLWMKSPRVFLKVGRRWI